MSAVQVWIPHRVRGAALVVVTFMLVYNVSFLTAPSLTSGRVAILALLVAAPRVCAAAVARFVRANWAIAFAFCAASVYALALYVLSGAQDQGQLSRLVHFLVLSVLGALAVGAMVDNDPRRFAAIFATAVFAQAVLILYSYVSPSYRMWLSTVLVQGGAIPLTYALQVPGFSNSSGASLSAIQGLGVFAGLFCMRSSHSIAARTMFLCVALVNAASTVVTGRTGLIMAVIFVAAFIVAASDWRHRAMLGAATAGAIVLAAWQADALIASMERVNPSVVNTLSWGLGVFSRGTSDPVLIDLVSQTVPPLTLDTVLGTGLISDAYGNVSQNDSGYIQTYYALGLLMTVVFYGALAVLLLRYVVRTREAFVLGVLVLSVFVAEYKEPFIFKYALPFFAIGLVRLMALDRRALHRAATPAT